jgi:hypothetical protein
MSLNKLREWAENCEPEDGGWMAGYEAARRWVRELLKNVSPVVQTHSFTVEEMIPVGWVLISCDFSVKHTIHGIPSEYGSVLLKRAPDQQRKWHALSDENKADVALYVSGSGKTFAEALADACQNARDEGTIA